MPTFYLTSIIASSPATTSLQYTFSARSSFTDLFQVLRRLSSTVLYSLSSAALFHSPIQSLFHSPLSQSYIVPLPQSSFMSYAVSPPQPSFTVLHLRFCDLLQQTSSSVTLLHTSSLSIAWLPALPHLLWRNILLLSRSICYTTGLSNSQWSNNIKEILISIHIHESY